MLARYYLVFNHVVKDFSLPPDFFCFSHVKIPKTTEDILFACPNCGDCEIDPVNGYCFECLSTGRLEDNET